VAFHDRSRDQAGGREGRHQVEVPKHRGEIQVHCHVEEHEGQRCGRDVLHANLQHVAGQQHERVAATPRRPTNAPRAEHAARARERELREEEKRREERESVCVCVCVMCVCVYVCVSVSV
jgi:hypothetical protein